MSVQLDPGPYEVMTEGYLSAQLLVSESGFSGQMTLEYERFVHPTGWDTDQADLSGMNNETPWVGMLPIASGDLLPIADLRIPIPMAIVYGIMGIGRMCWKALSRPTGGRI